MKALSETSKEGVTAKASGRAGAVARRPAVQTAGAAGGPSPPPAGGVGDEPASPRGEAAEGGGAAGRPGKPPHGGRILEIRRVGDPVLRRRAKPVPRVTSSLRALVADMLATMYAADGVGLAAPQVGVSRRLIVVDVGEGPVVLFNPEVLHREGEELGTEGCLSVPGKAGEVKRAARVRVRGLDGEGRPVWHEAEGLFARALQHEVDHLDGILFVDRAERVWDVPPETNLRLVFFGTPGFGARVLEGLLAADCRVVAVVTRPDRPRGRGGKVLPSPVREAAERAGLPVLQPEGPGDAGFLEEVAALRPDVLVTAAYGRLLPPALLALPRLAALNVHPSLLPAYRGPAPVLRALLDGVERTGVTVMRMTEELDAGDVVLQREMEVGPEEDRGSLERRLAEEGARLLVQALRLLAGGELPARRQRAEEATYAPALRPEEERLDWAEPAVRVVNRVRALAPEPGAHTFFRGRRLQVLAASLAEGPAPPAEGVSPAGAATGAATAPLAPAAGAVAAGDRREAEPGEILEVRPGEGFTVAAGTGAVLVRVVKPEGGRAMTAAEFANGARLRAGERLGA